MKIKSLMLKNFATVSEITVNFSDSVTYLCGGNGSGKTTIGLNAIWFILKGLAQKGIDVLHAERFRFIGPAGASAKGTIEVHDEKEDVTHVVTRKLLKNKAELEIKSSDGIKRGEEFLDTLFSAILINPMHFSQLSGKEQALTLGVDTAEFDQKRKALEQDRLLIGREATRLKGAVETAEPMEEVQAVSVSELLEELNRRRNHNEQHGQEITELESIAREIERQEEQISQRAKQVLDLQAALKLAENDYKVLISNKITQAKIVDKLVFLDEAEIEKQIEEAEEINTRALAYKEYLKHKETHEAKEAEYTTKKDEIEAVDIARTKYLKDQKLPFSNITINEVGELRLNDKPFCSPYFSTGELLKFGAKLGAKIAKKGDKKLDYVYIPDCQDLDEENREKLFQGLVKEGMQVVAEFVSTEKQKRGHSILLKECRVVESYSEKSGAELT